MYLEEIAGKLQGHEVKIKYDCDGGFENCGQEKMLKLKYAEKNFQDNEGKHICRKCFLKNKNPMKKQENKEKVKKTCLEKYGATTAMNSKENIESRVEKMFGSEESTQKIVAKRKATSKERYGADHIMKTKEGISRQKKSMQEKYGVDHPYQSQEILDKMKENNLKKYGVENVAQLPEIQIKMAQTTLEKYGVERYNQLPEMKDYLRENCREWLKESWENGGPMKGIIRPEEWNQKQRETVSELMMMGLWKAGYPRSHKGFCFPKNKCKKKKVYFRSSYEAIYCFYLDGHPDVEWFSFEAFRIAYEFNGKQHYYIPDFLIKWKNNNKLSIKELKAEFLRDDEQVEIKIKFAQIFAAENNMDFEMLFCKDINALGISFESLKEKEFIK